MKKQLQLHLLGAVLLLVFSACQKGIETEKRQSKQGFTASDAKEWYYGTFKKSTDWQQSKQSGQKLPNWKISTAKSSNGFSFVEFPLVKSKTALPIPEDRQLTNDEISKVAAASISKALFIRKPNGEIDLQEVYFIPDYSYLQKKNFDISNVSSLNYRDLTGVIFKRDWNGEEITAWKIENGTATRKGKLKSSNSNKPNMTEEITCYSQQFCVWQQDCVANFYPDGLVTTDCGEWYNTGECWIEEWCIGSDPCEENPENCNGGGGEDPPPSGDPCAEAQSVSTETKALSQNTTYSDSKAQILNAYANDGKEHGVTLGIGANGEITASPMTTGNATNGTVPNWPNAFADIHNHPDENCPGSGDLYGLIERNNANSNYDSRIVVTSGGTVYALVILDPSAANAFYANHPLQQVSGSSPNFPDYIMNLDVDIRYNLTEQGMSNGTAMAMSLAYILDHYNTGMILLRQDANGDFKRLRTQESTTNGQTNYTANNCQ